MSLCYIAVIGQQSGYALSVTFPDFDELFTGGDSFEHAVEMAKERLAIEIDSLREASKELPAPNSFKKFAYDIDSEDAVYVVPIPYIEGYIFTPDAPSGGA